MKLVVPTHSFEYAGATVAVYHANIGEGIPMHEHSFKHATVCHVGSCVVRVKGKEIIMLPDTMPLDLPAYIPHEIESLENGTVFSNIFATQVT